MATLTVINGALKGQRISLDQPTTTIGRVEGNTWVLADASVSGAHCEIEKTVSGFILRDLGSTNGTKVNNLSTTTAVLHRNDIIMFGEVTVMIDGDDVPQSLRGETQAIARTTIVIPPPKDNAPPPAVFAKKSNSNKIWMLIIAVLVLIIIGMLVVFFTR